MFGSYGQKTLKLQNLVFEFKIAKLTFLNFYFENVSFYIINILVESDIPIVPTFYFIDKNMIIIRNYFVFVDQF